MLRRRASILLLAFVSAALLAAAGVACKKSSGPGDPAEKQLAELEAQKAAAEAAAEEAAKAPPKPEPKMNEDRYVEISARSVLIQEKYKDDPDPIDPEMEKVYEKFGVTQAEFLEFKKALTPEKEGELQKKIQDKIQTLEREYK